MLSRREIITGGVAGGLATAPVGALGSTGSAQQGLDDEALRDIARQVQDIEDVLRESHLSSSLAHGFVGRLRAEMTQFLRANNKFPEFIDIGINVFYDVYDWHVKNRQPLTTTRLADGRYALQFMFSLLILRPEQDAGHVGIPFDKA